MQHEVNVVRLYIVQDISTANMVVMVVAMETKQLLAKEILSLFVVSSLSSVLSITLRKIGNV